MSLHMTKIDNWTLEIQKDPETGELLLEFPDELMQKVGWKVDDTVVWTDNKDGSWSLSKKILTIKGVSKNEKSTNRSK